MTYKFIVKTNHEASEIISDAMFELGAMGISITDPKDFDEIDKNGVVWDYIDEAEPNEPIRTYKAQAPYVNLK